MNNLDKGKVFALVIFFLFVKRMVCMYSIGEYVFYKTTGTCTVEDVTAMTVPGTKDTKDYYVLKPVFEDGGLIYCPVDHIAQGMRTILSKDEARGLIEGLSDLPLLDSSNKKQLDESCKNAISSGLSREYLIVMKTLWVERVGRLAAGKKLTTTNERFFKTCQDKLCGELAVALGCEKTEMISHIRKMLESL